MSLTQDEVIQLAKEVGLQPEMVGQYLYVEATPGLLLRLAQACYDAGAKAENEVCAKVCDGHHDKARTSPGAARALACAEAIRKRGK